MDQRRTRRFSWGAVFTGSFVALGGIAVFLILIATVLLMIGMEPREVSSGDLSFVQSLAITFTGVIALFLIYHWAGYVAARLARGGFGHALMVPLVNLLLAAALLGILVLSGAAERQKIPFTPATFRASLKEGFDALVLIGFSLALLAKFTGSIVGGASARRKRILEEEGDLTIPEELAEPFTRENPE